MQKVCLSALREEKQSEQYTAIVEKWAYGA